MKRILFFTIIGATVAATLIYSGILCISEALKGKKHENESRMMKDAAWATIE